MIDADDVVLGRLAVTAATLLRGKHKPTYAPHVDGGDFVVVVNASKIALGGNKRTDKLATGTPVALAACVGARRRTAHQDPRKAVELAVWGMLPKNKLSRRLIKKLKVYAGPEHPHRAQQPQVVRDHPDRPVARKESKEPRSLKPQLRPTRSRPLRSSRTTARSPTAPRRRRRSPRDRAGDPAVVAPTGATGRRKEAVARVRIVPGSGKWTINGRTLEDYFPNKVHQQIVSEPFVAAAVAGSYDVIARIHGGGITGQAGALRLGVARSLNAVDAEASRPALKKAGMLTRDARIKERKKAGLKKARKAPQYSKR